MRSAALRCAALTRQLDRVASQYSAGCSNAACLQAPVRGLASSTVSTNVVAAIILERLPVITPEPPAWEVEYQTWKQMRDEAFRQPMPQELIEMRNLGGASDDEDEDEDGDEDEEGVEDVEEEEEEEEAGGEFESAGALRRRAKRAGRKARYEPAPRRTAADESGDVRSLERALDQRLFMVVCEAGKGGRWRFPQAAHAGGETMRGAAQRALEAALAPDPELQTWFVGRSPCLHHPALGEEFSKRKRPRAKAPKAGATPAAAEGGAQGGAGGDAPRAEVGDPKPAAAEGGQTLFFHRAQLIRGVPALRAGSGFTDYAWLTKAELGTRLADAALVEQLQKAL